MHTKAFRTTGSFHGTTEFNLASIYKSPKYDKFRSFRFNQHIFKILFSTASTKTHLFHQIINKYSEIPNILNSRIIREITFNLNASKYLMPSLFENLIRYVVDNKDYVLGDTVEKVLYCCYNLGFMPQDDDFFNSSIEIINRFVFNGLFFDSFLTYIYDNYASQRLWLHERTIHCASMPSVSFLQISTGQSYQSSFQHWFHQAARGWNRNVLLKGYISFYLNPLSVILNSKFVYLGNVPRTCPKPSYAAEPSRVSWLSRFECSMVSAELYRGADVKV